jgi:hypothetical protein
MISFGQTKFTNACAICGMTLSSKRNVARHMKNIHGKIKILIDPPISIPGAR